MDKIISIIIPVYNGESWMEKCISSVLSQTYKNLEIIVVDDGSTDKSFQIGEHFLEKDSRIKLLRKTNNGQSSARNLGLKHAKGSYIQFVDCDDTLQKNACEIAINGIEANSPADLLLFGFNIYKDGVLLRKPNPSNNHCQLNFESYENYLRFDWLMSSPCNKFYKRDTIKCFFPEDLIFGEDTYFNYSNLFPGITITTIETCLYNVCLDNENSVNKGYRKGKIYSILQGAEVKKNKMIEIFGNKYNRAKHFKAVTNGIIYSLEICASKNSYKLFRKEVDVLNSHPYFISTRSKNNSLGFYYYFLIKMFINNQVRLSYVILKLVHQIRLLKQVF
jgi:glycosyltransferase involved in cell wall biosynthesis